MVTSGCLYFVKKFDELSKSVAFGEIEVFYRPEGTEVMNLKMNLKHFQIQKWMLQADKEEKVDEKNGVIYEVFMFPSRVMILKLSKKVHFFNLCWPQQKSLSMLKQLLCIIIVMQQLLSEWIHTLKRVRDMTRTYSQCSSYYFSKNTNLCLLLPQRFEKAFAHKSKH